MPQGHIEPVSGSRAAELDDAFEALLQEHRIHTAGVAIIKDGRLEWSQQYGEQAPGTPASKDTLFNIASITKTVTAETVLRLAANGELSLDEPMSDYWLDPDLVNDPRHALLTPRMALTHTTGFPNWRYFTSDRKLAMLTEPGSEYEYSGEGMEYVAKFVARKLDAPFEELARRVVFERSGITSAALTVRSENFDRMAQARDGEGKFYGHYKSPEGWGRSEGDFSAAGGLVITIDDYAKFLIAAMDGQGLTPELLTERNQIATKLDDIDGSGTPSAICPTSVGYGLGWYVAELPGDTLIGHRGSMWSTVAVAYYYEETHDGLIVVLNAPNAAGIAGMVDALTLLDPDSPELHGYKTRLARTLR